ncbi:MAG: DNA-directed RNA polymerase subunit G [Sulfolobales archaeon]|nr:DNA-directed RNA polymerase subunit G [Sulfolobales archaeon]MCX8198950.1 DNA-directed RNA polymerase subunit G [Sulfolobales archaeon]MDW8169928.1 DNA-directed RNA polymerase subunit G [Desulfurococcaceae archaeon]
MSDISLECTVESEERLKMPRVRRYYADCNKLNVVIELHEDVYKLKQGVEAALLITSSKDRCLEADFCGHGYLLSISNVSNKWRMILSIHGLLIVIYEPEASKLHEELKLMEKYYVGLSLKEKK